MMRDLDKKLFCASLILQPLLRLYGLPGIGGTFGDYVLIAIVIDILLKKNSSILTIKSKTETFELIPIMICVMFNILFTWNPSFEAGNQIIYWFRYVMYYFVLIYGIKQYYSIEIGYKIYKFWAFVCTIFLFIQYFASVFMGIYIPGQFGTFALTDVAKRIERYNVYSNYNLFRPDSLFSEPSHYATFVSGFILLCSLLDVNKKNIFAMLISTLGVLLSGSTTGLIITALIWTIWIFRLLAKKDKFKYLFPIIILGILALVGVSKTNSFKIMMNRTFASQDALNSRFDWLGSLNVFTSPIQWMFGLGNSSDVIQLTGWIPGWVIILISYGVLGLLLFLTSYFLLFWYADRNGKTILLYLIIMGFGTELIADMYVLVLLPFVINKEEMTMDV